MNDALQRPWRDAVGHFIFPQPVQPCDFHIVFDQLAQSDATATGPDFLILRQ
jgi:hypothetical protein